MTRILRAGAGLGWRPETAWLIDGRRGSLPFTEVIAENVCTHGPLLAPLARLRDAGMPVVPHGVSLGLGGAHGPDPARLDRLARVAVRLEAPLVSEHVAFVRGGGRETEHLLPVPRTRENLEVLVENVRRAAEVLPVPLALENLAMLVQWPAQEIDEAAFLRELLERTDALLLLDLSNLWANARNFGWDALALLDALPLERLAYVHVAGGVARGDFYHDTHAHPLGAGSLELLGALCERVGEVPVLLERDAGFDGRAELEREIDLVDAVVRAAPPAPAQRRVPGPGPRDRAVPLAPGIRDARRRLAADQAELVEALLAGGAARDLDPAALATASRVVTAKRARVEARRAGTAGRGTKKSCPRI